MVDRVDIIATVPKENHSTAAFPIHFEIIFYRTHRFFFHQNKLAGFLEDCWEIK